VSDLRLNIADVDFVHDSETREARHELLAAFLGAYADGELPAETQSQIDAHLVGCERCRRELELHRTVRDRLSNEPVPAASAALRDRITAGVRVATPPVMSPMMAMPVEMPQPPGTSRRQRFAAALIVVAIVVAAIGGEAWRNGELVAPPGVSLSASARVPLFASVLADYRRVTAGDLPGRARDLAAVRAAVPFAFAPIPSASLRLLAAWTTSLNGEPAAVLAYRWNDRVVLQYFVTEGLLFQSPDVRASLARKQDITVNDGRQGMLLWAEPEYGSVLVGDLAPAEFTMLRAGGDRR
jgi:anti-sigma factor RsiW